MRVFKLNEYLSLSLQLLSVRAMGYKYWSGHTGSHNSNSCEEVSCKGVKVVTILTAINIV